MLAGHLDTVPFQGEIGARLDGDRVHGLGATDMKGGLAVMIHLVEVLGGEKVACVFYSGEEGPLLGNQLTLVIDEALWLRRSSAAVVLEPTDRAIEAGCQGVINAEAVFTGHRRIRPGPGSGTTRSRRQAHSSPSSAHWSRSRMSSTVSSSSKSFR